MTTDATPARSRLAELGPNAGLIDEMYHLYRENPNAVSEGWREFFADYQPRPDVAAPVSPPPPLVAKPTAPSAPIALDGDTPRALRGASARIVDNMVASLAVPTATSVRTLPAKLLEINRQILNNQLARDRGGKVSFTHLIGFAVVRALQRVPNMNASFGVVDGTPSVVHHERVNLGLAIDQQKADGSRTLLVPNIKSADALDFAGFHAAYEDLIRRARTNKLTVDDFAGTTASLTNPGTIGTLHSVPRLMPGQGVIVGVGAITYPPEYEGADPQTLAEIGVSKTVTLTSTYDHRIIQGAESGEFLATLHDLLLGGDEFYDDLFASFAVPYEPARWSSDRSPSDSSVEAQDKIIAVQQLINMYRVRGHLIANLDPLGLKEPRTHEELDPNHWGLTIWDLDREFPTGGLAGHESMKLRDILGVLRDAYARTIGVEYMHIQEPDQKSWIQHKVEGIHGDTTHADTTLDDKRRILSALNGAEAFERFLHTKFLGQKRFSLEGAETLIPMLDFLLEGAADVGMEEVVMGMAHRGRLNVLANVVGKSYEQIFREFEGELDPNVPQGSGDVKYHLGAGGKYAAASGVSIGITLAANPSHLEAVDPVAEGMARAKQDRLDDADHERVLSVLIHGDAAFAGQGVVAETLNLSELPGYDVGGTVHIVVNNQVGFTTTPGFAALDGSRHRHRQGGASADLPRERRRPGSCDSHDPLGLRVPQRVQEGRRCRHGLLPTLRTQRERRARVHAAPHVRGDREAAIDPQAVHRVARQPGRPHAGRGRGCAGRFPIAPGRGIRRDQDQQASARDDRNESPRAGALAPRHRRRPRAARPHRHDADDLPRRLRAPPEARPHPRRRAGRHSTTITSTGRWPRRSRSARCCWREHRCASPGRTLGGARSASATRPSWSTGPKRSSRPSRTSAPTRRRS